MASTSSSAPCRPTVVLPSIHEMFPEHLMPRSAPRAIPPPIPSTMFPPSYYPPQPAPPPTHPSCSFDVLKSDPRGSSLQHIASSRPTRPPVRTQVSQPHPISRAHSSSGSSDDEAEMELDGEDGEDGDGMGAEECKRHVCPTCSKRFNRPSSLRIHRNTHTGATRECQIISVIRLPYRHLFKCDSPGANKFQPAFRCPYPSCGRQFNVNSNMRRHFRNHTTSAYAGASNASASSPVSPTSPSSFSSYRSYTSNSSPSSYTSSPTSYTSSPTSPSWSSASSPSPSRYSPPTALPTHAHRWDANPRSYRDAPAYCESDARSQRR
ncbi:hypothetical protein DFH06DRAFT_1255878 [Mycena polygramma]|nr:hypothetical protein DFH06DRAFT_1255878 [Mycena polygramma]